MVLYKKIMSLLGVVSFSMLVSVLSNTAIAVTPDGETPANEGVCDSLHGGTPGLYGLCVAYCEAQDLDSIDKSPPSTKILANYRKKMNAGDTDMPCVQVSCPCFSDIELNAMTGDAVASCSSRLISNKLRIDDDGILNFASVDASVSRERCGYVDVGAVPRIVKIQSLADDSESTAAQKAQSCYNLIDAACVAVQQ